MFFRVRMLIFRYICLSEKIGVTPKRIYLCVYGVFEFNYSYKCLINKYLYAIKIVSLRPFFIFDTFRNQTPL